MLPIWVKYQKTLFFVLVIVTFTVVTTWDYGNSYAQWNSYGLPASVIAALICYAYVYKQIVPAYRLKKSALETGVYAAGYVVFYIGLHFLISKLFISDEEYLTVYQANRPSAVYENESHLSVNATLFLGLLLFAPVSLAIYAFIAYWHSRKHLRKRVRQWWKVGLKKWWLNQRASLSWLHLGWLVFGWVLWFLLNNFSVLLKGKDIAWSTSLLMLMPSMLFFYINLKTNFNLLARNKVIAALLFSFILWGVLLIVKGSWFLFITKVAGFPPVLDGINIYEKLKSEAKTDNISGSGYIAGITIGYFLKNAAGGELIILLTSFIYGYGQRAIQYQRELRTLDENRQRELLKQKALEKEVVDARLQSLKYQINPHFLFNSLNFLYSQALPLSDDLARATMLLSKMMRYGLQENSEEAKVALSGEIEHLYNFIEFNQLRFSNQLQVDFQVEGNVAIRRIMPLLLITFVENAFKYGELQRADAPLRIQLKVDSEKMEFQVHNKKRNGPKEDSTGIGIENIRKRLLLGYPGKHTLNISEDESFYDTKLTIIL
ncbi:histidine kinase [Dyadobacter sp. 32]|uniref:sensor histidine kinase n=1 Tax=Dyadobacter sp. 32 TaxID=538966 RepID=UPI0011EC6EF8